MRNERTALTFESKLRFYNAHIYYMNEKGDAGQCYVYAKKMIDLYHSHPHKIHVDIAFYIIYLHNLIVASINEKKYREAATCLEAMERASLIAKTRSQKVACFYYYYYLLLGYYNRTGQFANAIETLVSFKKQLEEFENGLNELEKIVLFTNIAISYFGAGQYKQSNAWLNYIRNEIALTAHPDIDSMIKIFHLVVHYEAGNFDLLPYAIQSTYRFLHKKERLYKFEMIIIDFLRNEIPKAAAQKDLIDAFKKLKIKMLPLEKDPYKKNALDSFDFISWLDSKIANRPFAEVVRGKAAIAK